MSSRNLILSLTVASLLALAPLRAEVKAGDAFPALAEAGLTGGAVPATAGKIVVVDFWASWCAPCKASFPALAKIQTDYAARGVLIVAVSVDEKAANYAAFVKKWAPPFAVVHDQSHRLASTVDVPAMPSSYVLGRDGRVRFVHQGFHGAATDRELRDQLDQLLAEKN